MAQGSGPETDTTLADIHRRQNYLTHETILQWASHNRDVDYRHRDFLFDSGDWRGSSWRDVRETESTASTLVIGHSDRAIDAEDIRKIFNETGYSAVFGCNLTAEAAAVTGVHDFPLGLPNKDRTTRTHKIQGSTRPLRSAWRKIAGPALGTEPTLYANFSLKTHPESRRRVYEIVSLLPHGLVGVYEQSKNGRASDFNNIRASGLVVAPRGNGVDTHRIYETLLLGAVPIVLQRDRTAQILADLALPHIALDSWNRLHDWPSIVETYFGLQEKQFNFKPLTSDFWKQRIMNLGY